MDKITITPRYLLQPEGEEKRVFDKKVGWNMQTFLPYASFYDTARTLDDKRLGKQRVEALQILLVIAKPVDHIGGWVNHPVVNMWRGYEDALKIYTNCMIVEWERRGYQNTMQYYDVHDIVTLPWWLGDFRIHDSHKSNLLRKFPEFYRALGWNVPSDMPYFWPVEGRPNPKGKVVKKRSKN